jgi:hypothetical protein
MLNKFLDKLDLDKEPELFSALAQLHSHHPSSSSSSDDSDDSDDGSSKDTSQPSTLTRDSEHDIPGAPNAPDDDSNDAIDDPSQASSTTSGTSSTSSHSSQSNLDLDELFHNFDVDPNYAQHLENYYDLQRSLHNVSRELSSTKRLLKMASGQDTKLKELQQLMFSPDPNVRHRAGEELGERLKLLDGTPVNRRLNFSDSSSSESDTQKQLTSTPDPHMPNPILDRERLFRDYTKRVHKLKERLSQSGPLDPAIKDRIETSLKKAKLHLQKTKLAKGLDDSPLSSELSPDSNPDLNISFNTATSDSESQQKSPQHSDDSASDPELLEQTGTQFYNTIYQQEANMQNIERGLEWDDFDLQQRQQTPPVALPERTNQQEAIKEWLANSPDNADIQNNDRIPVTTRYGRAIKARKIFDPADELEREKELKVAHKKVREPSVIKPPTQSPLNPRDNPIATPQPGSSGIHTQSQKSKRTPGLAVKSSRK